MLAVEGRHDLARIKIRERYDLHLREAEVILDSGRYGPHFRSKNTAAKDRRHLDLDLRAVLVLDD